MTSESAEERRLRLAQEARDTRIRLALSRAKVQQAKAKPQPDEPPVMRTGNGVTDGPTD